MSHYYSKSQSSLSNEFEINVSHKFDNFFLLSDSGIFSKDKLDFASKLLIENAVVKESDDVLDLGCGNGVIGISMIRMHKCRVSFVDVNERAVNLTAKNLKRLNLEGEVFYSDLFSNISKSFDVILSNPPYAAGRKVCFDIIEQSYKHLNNEGSLQLVARHNKGGKVLGEHMLKVFGNMEFVAKGGGFRIYMSKKREGLIG